MKVLVTGSSGFVGKYVTAELKNRKHYVKEFDMEHGKNIFNEQLLAEEMQGTDCVIHLAAVLNEGNPDLWNINVEGTTRVIEAAVKGRVKKFIYLSSTGVYGFTECNVSEETEINPQTPYEKSKAEAEKIVLSHQEEISVCVLRSAMVFGPNAYWKGMFKLLGREMPLPCKGKNSFQVIYIKELAKALMAVMEKGEDGETYLVAGKEAPTLNEFCKMVQKEMGLKQGVKHTPTWFALLMGKLFRIKVITRENIRHLSKERKYDTHKIEELGYKPTISLGQAIFETISGIKELEEGQEHK